MVAGVDSVFVTMCSGVYIALETCKQNKARMSYDGDPFRLPLSKLPQLSPIHANKDPQMLWTLARDDATPFSGIVGRVSPTHRNPFNATFVCGCCCTILGCIYIASQTAFNAFVASFAILTTMSYL